LFNFEAKSFSLSHLILFSMGVVYRYQGSALWDIIIKSLPQKF